MKWWIYLIIIFGGFLLTMILANWQTRGLMFRLMVIRRGGSRILLMVRSNVNDYFRIAHKVGERVLYKKRGEKDITPLIIPKNDNPFRRILGVVMAEVKEENNVFILEHGEVVPGFDAETWEKLYIRAMMDMGDKINWKLILIVLIVVGVAVLIVGGMVHGNTKAIAVDHGLLLNITARLKGGVV